MDKSMYSETFVINSRATNEEMYALLATHQYEGISYNRAICDYRNYKQKGKFVITESRKGYNNRMFIRRVTNPIEDAFHKYGWWNTFCLSKENVSNGIWLSKIEKFTLDKDENLMVIVEPIIPIDDVKMHDLFDFDVNGSWGSTAIELMVSDSGLFIPEYEFKNHYRRKNISMVKKKFGYVFESPSDYKEMCKSLLFRWLSGDVSLTEIEDALNAPNQREVLLEKIEKAIRSKNFTGFEKYPIFCQKIINNCREDIFGTKCITADAINNYINRNYESYSYLLISEKITACESDDILEKVETVLRYRASEKMREKEARKAARLRKKHNNS